MITPRDADELAWYFGGGDIDPGHDSAFWGGSSGVGGGSFGEQLDRARVIYRDSSGEVVPPSGRIAHVLVELPDGKYTRRHALWPHAVAKKPLVVPSAFLPDPGTSHDLSDAQVDAAEERYERRSTRRERVLARIGRLDPEAYETVRLLYGPRGEQWNQTPRGRVWSLLPVTEVGAKHRPAGALEGDWLADLDLCTARGWADALKHLPAEQARRGAVRKAALKWLDAALNQAEARQRRAGRAWAATAPRRAPQPVTEDA